MRLEGYLREPEEAEAMARAAADSGGGRMEAFWAEGFASDHLLRYIAERASSLKSLRLSFCHDVSNEGLAEAVKSFPQLEELEISFCSLYANVCESVGKACPRLKRFRLNKRRCFLPMDYACYVGQTEALGIASTMPELQVGVETERIWIG